MRFTREAIRKSRELARHLDVRIDAGLVEAKALDAIDDEAARVGANGLPHRHMLICPLWCASDPPDNPDLATTSTALGERGRFTPMPPFGGPPPNFRRKTLAVKPRRGYADRSE